MYCSSVNSSYPIVMLIYAVSQHRVYNLHNLSFFAQTEKGSALHEAALFGKTDVVQRLLSAG